VFVCTALRQVTFYCCVEHQQINWQWHRDFCRRACEQAAVLVNHRVVINNLTEKQQHNGKVGIVTAYDPVKRRYTVVAPDADGLLLKTQNLTRYSAIASADAR
jgi:hypothetical protein